MKAEIDKIERYEKKTDDTHETYESGVLLTIRIPVAILGSYPSERSDSEIKYEIEQNEMWKITIGDTLTITK
jgi:hypothetical protein